MVEVKENKGLLFEDKNFKLVKKVAKRNEEIKKHNHPEANVLFTIVKGECKVLINEKDSYLLTPGMVLHFDGDNYISAEFLEDSEVFVTLILKK